MKIFKTHLMVILFFLLSNKIFAVPVGIDSVYSNPFVLYSTTNPKISAIQLASYCAPVFWFSPDEPQLKNKSGKNILIPEAFPFEKKGNTPVVYYEISEILTNKYAGKSALSKDNTNFNNSIIDLSKVSAFNINYSHYYEFEAGLGTHHHDTEQAQFNIYVHTVKQNNIVTYYLIFIKATAKAHALVWYDNIFTIDTNMTETKLPFHILVEEGKHASCTDANADGYYTPGYDVNVRVNDAWGLRDVIRTGELFTSDFQSYMAKVRRPEHKIFPPLPEDSPLRNKYSVNNVYSPENAIYELRLMPSPESALPDVSLKKDMEGYTGENLPRVLENSSARKFLDWWETDLLLNSFSINAMYDKDFGVSFVFPLLIFKNVETPLIGGWTVNRIYLKDKKLRDFGYNILLTPSASRFMDPYFAFGIEVDSEPREENPDEFVKKGHFVLETGIKFRANLKFSPLKFLSFLTEFWGLRLGIKNKGFPDINSLHYVIEIGAGVW